MGNLLAAQPGISGISKFLDTLRDNLPSGSLRSLIYAVLIVVGGFLVARLVRRFLSRRSMHPQQQMILGRLLSYGVYALALSWALREIGVSVGALIGGLGILTVALGFGARVGTSNLICGLLLMAERPFMIGDVIKVGDATGTVLSVDLFAVQLRTVDNVVERVPNELIMRVKTTVMSRFPIRRLDIKFGVPKDTELAKVKKVLLEVAAKVPLCLEEPKPRLFNVGFSESAIDLQLSVWSVREKLLELRDQINERLPKALAAADLQLATPQRIVMLLPQAVEDEPEAISAATDGLEV